MTPDSPHTLSALPLGAQSSLTPNAAAGSPALAALSTEMLALREHLLKAEQHWRAEGSKVAAMHEASAANLAHYLALRSRDLRPLQGQLSAVGLSSLGRCEAAVLHAVEQVLARLGNPPAQAKPGHAVALSGQEGDALLRGNALRALGAQPAARDVRIMVTLPSTAASDAALVYALAAAGMDVARINCAHDNASAWAAMAQHVRAAAQRLGRDIRILMDLGGPKLRTGSLGEGVAVMKLRPPRDDLGRVVHAGRLALRPLGSAAQASSDDGAQAVVDVDAAWFAQLRADSGIAFTDARGAKRRWQVVAKTGELALVEFSQTCYLDDNTLLRRGGARGKSASSRLHHLPRVAPSRRLCVGDTLLVLPEGQTPSVEEVQGVSAFVGCTLPAALAVVQVGQRVLFDDGRLAGIVRQASPRALHVEITQARAGGDKLRGDKGINFPDTALAMPALTDKDLADLAEVVKLADLVGLSFCQRPEDVHQLLRQLARHGASHLGIVLKIETQCAFENLPHLLLAAMASTGPAAVMIARGDLAVEVGYERLAEVQEEILWACEAAHMPVIWATQVLESLAATGRPSRAEITDAAMGVRAECVMLNKGPHIVQAMQTLDDILLRMQDHQDKKISLLRALRAWAPLGEAPAAGSGN